MLESRRLSDLLLYLPLVFQKELDHLFAFLDGLRVASLVQVGREGRPLDGDELGGGREGELG